MVLSFADSDLSALAAAVLPPPACGGEGGGTESRSSTFGPIAERNCPPPQPSPPQAGEGRNSPLIDEPDLTPSRLSLRLAPLRRLRHPLSVDLLIEKTVAKSRFVLLRCLGGLDYWRYGIEQISAACRREGIALAVLPGDDRPDERLAEYGTVDAAFAEELLGYFHAGGGAENMRRLLGRIAAISGSPSLIRRCRAPSPARGEGRCGRHRSLLPSREKVARRRRDG